MNAEIINGILTLIGTTSGTIVGIVLSNRLSNYRIEQLEKKLDKYTEQNEDQRIKVVLVDQTAKTAYELAEKANRRIDELQNQL
jgi:hypothetical protein